MSQNFRSNEELLTFVSDEGVGRTHSQGYCWFWQKFMPALHNTAGTDELPSELLVDCYYIAGDVHDFNEAPKAAISCYKEALKIDPTCGAAHREIANMLGRMGRYEEALLHSDIALALNPEDEYAISDRDEYVGENRLIPPLYKKRDRVWAAYEQLAKANPGPAIDLLNRAGGPDTQRAMIHCFGALDEQENYLETWRKVAHSAQEIEFTYADWFFMPEEVYSGSKLWKTLFSSKAKFNGVFATFEGLDKSERYRSLSTHDQIRLRIEYYVYEHSRDTNGLKRLKRQYPESVELGAILND